MLNQSLNKKLTLERILVCLVFLVMFLNRANAQDLDVPYVPTPDSIVERMLDMANVGPGDYLIDLGCGDGRINIAAAKRGALGHGVDLDPEMLELARENAVKHGVADKVNFVEENVYDTDFSRATVVAMYLFPSVNVKLRPKLLKNLMPGSRIVSHDFGMDEWIPDKKNGRMENHAVLLWIVPAQVAGNWNWKTKGVKFRMKINQRFQKIEPEVLDDNANLVVSNSKLSGKKISFSIHDKSSQKEYLFSGEVDGKKIFGIVNIHDGKGEMVEKWSATME